MENHSEFHESNHNIEVTEPLKVAVILNPKSGRGKGSRCRDALGALIKQHDPDNRVIETIASGSACDQARDAIEEGFNLIVAAGGDGTVNEVLNGVVGTEASLGLIPMGTGNDFARHMRINSDPLKAAYALFDGFETRLDVGQANGRYFINIAGCGFDAAVAKRINEGYKWLRGTSAYFVAVIATLMKYKACELELTFGNHSRTVRAMLCSVANASSYGGGMKIAPHANVEDGLFDVCILHEVGKSEFLKSFPKVFKGTHLSHPKIELVRCDHISIDSSSPLPLLIDGEVQGTTPVIFELLPGAVRFRCPSNQNADVS